MYTLTNDEIAEYEFEINKFWNHPNGLDRIYGDHGLYLRTYEKLCERLQSNPFTIQASKVYWRGEIDLPFLDAFFMAVGECCKKYNNQEYPIKYES